MPKVKPFHSPQLKYRLEKIKYSGNNLTYFMHDPPTKSQPQQQQGRNVTYNDYKS